MKTHELFPPPVGPMMAFIPGLNMPLNCKISLKNVIQAKLSPLNWTRLNILLKGFKIKNSLQVVENFFFDGSTGPFLRWSNSNLVGEIIVRNNWSFGQSSDWFDVFQRNCNHSIAIFVYICRISQSHSISVSQTLANPLGVSTLLRNFISKNLSTPCKTSKRIKILE